MGRSRRDRNLSGTVDVDAGNVLVHAEHLREHGATNVTTAELIRPVIARSLQAVTASRPRRVGVLGRTRATRAESAVITSAGPFGITTSGSPSAADHRVAVLVQVGPVEQRPVARAGLVLVRPMLTFTVSCDQRYISAAQAAELVEALRAYCADPAAFDDEVGAGVHGSAG